MSSPLILDASALLAIAKGELGRERVKEIIGQSFDNVFIHAVNAFEVAYKLMLFGVAESDAWEFFDMKGVSIKRSYPDSFTKKAALLKYGHPYLSMADCFCIALAEEMHGQVLTSDSLFAKVRTSAKVVMFR